jgi:3-hydroxymyristoyl/3-hydroxydecanoyl-(acyl carrier protein) dehydratase
MTAEAEDGVWFDGRIAVNGKVSCQGRVLMGRRTAETLYPAAGELPAALAVEATPGPAMDVNRIMECIPHRFPFLLVDRVLEMDMDALRILALKNVTANESFMEGCALPAMPGYLQCEAAAQAGCALALSIPENRDKLGFFMSIDTARFPAPVVAGEQVALEVEMVGRGRFGKADCVIRTGDGTCRATMELKFAIVDRE